MKFDRKYLFWAVAALLGSALLFLGVRAVTRPTLKYFSAGEFGLWWPLMNADLLVKLDAFREAWGAPVSLSAAEGGIGREDDSNSQHNAAKWGEVRAVDISPQGMNTAEERRRAVNIALTVGFTGIGIYREWHKPGLHLDVREPETPGHVATWAGEYKPDGTQQYVSIERGLA